MVGDDVNCCTIDEEELTRLRGRGTTRRFGDLSKSASESVTGDVGAGIVETEFSLLRPDVESALLEGPLLLDSDRLNLSLNPQPLPPLSLSFAIV